MQVLTDVRQIAWGMTMSGFRAAMEAKFPRSGKDKIPSNKRYEEAMDWADKIIMRDNAEVGSKAF